MFVSFLLCHIWFVSFPFPSPLALRPIDYYHSSDTQFARTKCCDVFHLIMEFVALFGMVRYGLAWYSTSERLNEYIF